MDLSSLPSISSLLQSPPLVDQPHDLAVQVARDFVGGLRRQLLAGRDIPGELSPLLSEALQSAIEGKLRPVINATGIVVHTNLGRAPLPARAVERIGQVASGYCNLEVDLKTGKRGGRLDGVSDRICRLTGAEACTVVNNNAAATMLALTAIAEGGEVVVSRGELVEIGGSFRVPDVISAGGAKLVEVGTTNKTRLSDYSSALGEGTGAILRVHPSNFKMVGFSSRPSRSALAELASSRGVPLLEDLGSGLLSHPPALPNAAELEEEESVSLALAAGVDLLTFSGDKLLGSAQAGFIVGRKDMVERCRSHPMYRALRLCKLSLAALEATLQLYAEGRASELPVWRMLERSPEDCREEARKIASELPGCEVIAETSFTGGGALPGQGLPTFVAALSHPQPNRVAEELRRGEPSLLLRVGHGRLLVDPRTLAEGDSEVVVRLLRRYIS
jgi:L-seryl-tRNA(Ser) seleniumtransferase